MVKLGCSFSGKPGKETGDQDGAAMDSVPLISPLDVSQLQPSFPDQVSSLSRCGRFSQACLGTEMWVRFMGRQCGLLVRPLISSLTSRVSTPSETGVN